MASTSRPVRSRNQPSRNKDNIELNLQLIEKLEASRTNKSNNSTATNYAKLFASFINSINQSYRSSQLKIEQQKKEQMAIKNKSYQSSEPPQWVSSREKKKYVMGSSMKSYTKTPPVSTAEQQKQKQKINNQNQKITRNNKPAVIQQPTLPPQTLRNPSKQQKIILMIDSYGIDSIKSKKPFKRASYHIGIAYTIYMQQIRQKNGNITDPRICDPTIYARKLKAGQMND